MLHGFWVLFLLAGRAVWGRALSGHGSQSLIILHFSPFGGGEGDGRKTVTKLVINAKRYFHLLSSSSSSNSSMTYPTGRHCKVMFWQPLSVVRLCSFFVSSVQLVFYDGGGGGGDPLALASFVWASRRISVDCCALGSGARCSGRL